MVITTPCKRPLCQVFEKEEKARLKKEREDRFRIEKEQKARLKYIEKARLKKERVEKCLIDKESCVCPDCQKTCKTPDGVRMHIIDKHINI